nr:MAG TPA: hypothetical protein [Caudoviricetes sp.]
MSFSMIIIITPFIIYLHQRLSLKSKKQRPV